MLIIISSISISIIIIIIITIIIISIVIINSTIINISSSISIIISEGPISNAQRGNGIGGRGS